MNLHERLLSSGLFIENDYLIKYERLIESNQDTEYVKFQTNWHHIVPRFYYQLNNKPIDDSLENKVCLVYRDHVKIHYYLSNCVKEQYYYKAICALSYLLQKRGTYHFTEDDISETILCTLQDIYTLQKISFSLKQLGHIVTEEQRRKISEAQKGKQLSESNRSGIREAHKGRITVYNEDIERQIYPEELEYYQAVGFRRGRSDKSRSGISKGSIGKPSTWTGKSMSEDAKKRIGNSNKGRTYVYKDNEVRAIKEEDLDYFLKQGYQRGNPHNGVKPNMFAWVCNDKEVKHIKLEDLDYYLANGYHRGRV